MPFEEELRLDPFSSPIKVLVVNENPEDWRLWKAFTSMLSTRDDLALRIYAMLLEKNGRASSRDIASAVNAPLYSVRRALGDLRELGLISRERIERGYMTFDYWIVKTKVLGILRLIPEQYFRNGYPVGQAGKGEPHK